MEARPGFSPSRHRSPSFPLKWAHGPAARLPHPGGRTAGLFLGSATGTLACFGQPSHTGFTWMPVSSLVNQHLAGSRAGVCLTFNSLLFRKSLPLCVPSSNGRSASAPALAVWSLSAVWGSGVRAGERGWVVVVSAGLFPAMFGLEHRVTCSLPPYSSSAACLTHRALELFTTAGGRPPSDLVCSPQFLPLRAPCRATALESDQA